jgi:hypothetical protein
MTYTVQFERVGRNYDVPPLTVEGDNADEIAFHIYTYARKFLASRDVEVLVKLDELRGSINYGRFGTFTLSEAA